MKSILSLLLPVEVRPELEHSVRYEGICQKEIHMLSAMMCAFHTYQLTRGSKKGAAKLLKKNNIFNNTAMDTHGITCLSSPAESC